MAPLVLTPQLPRRRIRSHESDAFALSAREAACVICRDGRCSALILSARPADIGYARITHPKSIAAIAASRCAMCRRL